MQTPAERADAARQVLGRMSEHERTNLQMLELWQTPGRQRQDGEFLFGPEVADLKAYGVILTRQDMRLGLLIDITPLGRDVLAQIKELVRLKRLREA